MAMAIAASVSVETRPAMKVVTENMLVSASTVSPIGRPILSRSATWRHASRSRPGGQR